MAGGMDLGTSAKGGKKPLDAAINLVPFIDLMAVTISFLIMTAVWTQLGRLQVASGGGGEGPPSTEAPLSLLVTPDRLVLTVGGATLDPIPLKALRAKLSELKGPDQTSITLRTEDAVKYDDLVHVIDEVIGAGLPSIQVTPATG